MSNPPQAAANPGPFTRAAMTAMRIAGALTLLYWGVHLIQHFKYWDLYQGDFIKDGNVLLSPYYRASIDIAAIAAGILMVAKSKWSLLPFALHFVAYFGFIMSITQGGFDSRFYPVSTLITLAADALLLVLLLVLEHRKTLGSWPRQNG